MIHYRKIRPFRDLIKLLIITMLLAYPMRGGLFAHAALLNPEGGEIFTAGQVIEVQWQVVIQHETENWDLFFSPDSGTTWQPLALDLPVDQLSFQWSIPYTETMGARVRVVQDNEGMDYYDDSEVFTIVVLPSDGPEMIAPAQDLLLECGSGDPDAEIEQWLDNHGGAMVTGSCGDLLWTHDYDGLTDGCGMTGMAVVTFSVSDNCGGTVTTATVSIQDSEGPVIEGPATDMVVECDGMGNTAELSLWLASSGGASASDICGNITWANDFSFLTDGCGSTGQRLVTFIAYDDCGNMSTTMAQFSIIDSTPPVVMKPAGDTVVQCSGADPGALIAPWLLAHGNAEVVDDCGNVSWSHDFLDIPEECQDMFSRIVHFTATDECANSTTIDATLSLQGSVGTDDMESQRDVDLYPNPAHKRLFLSFTEGFYDLHSASVFDATGILVMHARISDAKSIDLQDIVPGAYVVRIYGDHDAITKRLIVD